MAMKWSESMPHDLAINGNAVQVQVEHGLEQDLDTEAAINAGKGMLRLTIPSGHKITLSLLDLWELISEFAEWRARGAPEATKPGKGGK